MVVGLWSENCSALHTGVNIFMIDTTLIVYDIDYLKIYKNIIKVILIDLCGTYYLLIIFDKYIYL